MKTTVTVIIVLIILAGAYYFITNNPKTLPTPQSPTSTSVSVKDLSFTPASMTVMVGDTVTWTNNDNVAHTVTADNGLFDSKTLSPGQSFSYTFDTSGTYNYHCSIHTMMKGSVTAGFLQ